VIEPPCATVYKPVEFTKLPLPLVCRQREAGLAAFERALALNCDILRPRYLALPRSLALYERLQADRTPGWASGRLGCAGLQSTLDAAQHRFPNEDCVVFLRRHWFMGGLRMQMATFWVKAFDLLAFDGATVFAARPDGGDALMLDLDDAGVAAEAAYEIFAWGGRWPVYLPPAPPRDPI